MNEPLRARIASVLDQVPLDFGGGCSLSKACALATLIDSYRLRTTLDIGVYRGRSYFPQAIAHQLSSHGKVYGVDPYDLDAARERDTPYAAQIDAFLEGLDFEQVYQDVLRVRRDNALENHSELLRMPSAQAIRYFEKRNILFDLIHIDGNHDTRIVLEDIRLYVPRLRRNGFLVMDDISWDSVLPAFAAVATQMPVVFKRVDAYNDYAILWNADWFPALKSLTQALQPFAADDR
jgi:predicted O-methyltransferase YrrM